MTLADRFAAEDKLAMERHTRNLQADLDAANEALHIYGRHLPECKVLPCTCGFGEFEDWWTENHR